MLRHIPVSGWRPVDTRLRVSDIPKIVQTFGGERLYGGDETVPVRELIQNAIDAIQARRLIEGRGPDWGMITVELFERDGSVWLSVEDTGIGMSEAVLTGSLLDFGTSFWGSARMVEEFPGLAAKGMAALGRFGVGFFSVFMLGEHVRVITRRPDRAKAEASLLEFKRGLNSRPILSKPSNDEIPLDGGTRVEIRLRREPRVRKGIALREPPKIDFDLGFGPKSVFASLLHLVQWIAPAAPTSINVSEFGKSARAVSANDWLTIDVPALLSRVSDSPATAYLNMVRIIRDDSGQIVGRGAFQAPKLFILGEGVLVAGGLRVMSWSNWVGIVIGDVSKIDRASGQSRMTERATRQFINDQVPLVEASALGDEEKARFADLTLQYGGSIGSLPIARLSDKWVNSLEFLEYLKNIRQFVLINGEITYNDDADAILKWDFNLYFKPAGDLVCLPRIHLGHEQSSALGSYVLELCRVAWSDFSQRKEFERVVGTVHGQEITRSVTLLTREEPH